MKTAVEWLVQEINKINVSTEARIFINKLEKQAKEMEKQHIIDAYENGENRSAELYYDETYKQEKNDNINKA
jgi:hypothetical protein